jgi:amino acid adenylation domain-containing protein
MKKPFIQSFPLGQVVLDTWNDTARQYPHDQCIQELFEEQAQRTPEAVALVFEGVTIGYSALNARANCLAHHLISLGAGPEVLIAVCMERSIELIVALLGILKAGAAYVPMDPGFPKARLVFMLADTGTPILLTQQALLASLPKHPCKVLCVDNDWTLIASNISTNPIIRVQVDALAYVMFTSGSTGDPKGVMIEHRALVNHMAWMQDRFPLNTSDRLLLKTSISADASIWELFASLLCGARLVVSPAETHRSPDGIVDIVTREKITVVQLLPTMLEAILVGPGFLACTTLKRVYCGGEQLAGSAARRFRGQCAAELINLYGPTEATIDATYEVCECVDDKPVSIGQPISNTQLYIFDPLGNVLPNGHKGEIYIGGEGLARGYLNRQELTEQFFVRDPFSSIPSTKLYRTGDYGRIRDDGRFEFIGRIDHQLNIRGFRIEPAEIESVIAQHPSVLQVVAVARADDDGDMHLVVYLVSKDENFPSMSPLFALAREHLPQHMRPEAYVILKSMPLTPNGKFDRSALPTPQYGQYRSEALQIAPRGQVEETVAKVWCEILRINQVSVLDDFFELGGHSLLAGKMLARVAELTQVTVPLKHFFSRPTLEGVADGVSQTLAGKMQNLSKGLEPTVHLNNPIMSFAQKRLWFLHTLRGDSSAYGIRLAWRISGTIEINALRHALGLMVERHEILRTCFPGHNGIPTPIIGTSFIDMFAEIDLDTSLANESDAGVAQLIRSIQAPVFDLSNGFLLQMLVLRIKGIAVALLLDVHHIIFDGGSVGVFERELEMLYAATLKGEPALLPPRLQYVDYAHWQHSAQQVEEQERQLGYWKDKLSNLNPLNLPTDRSRSTSGSPKGAHLLVNIAAPLTRGVRKLARAERATLFMTLLTTFQVLLHRYSRQTDVCVGIAISGRSHAEFEHLIGMFVNTIALRSHVDGAMSFRQLLGRVREAVFEASLHADVPFEKLVQALLPTRDSDRNPLFQVAFALEDKVTKDVSLQEAKLVRLRINQDTAKFDLSLEVRDLGEKLQLSWEYSTDLFDRTTIERMSRHFLILLTAEVEDADQAVGSTPLILGHEREMILQRWNDTTAEYPRDQCIQALFEGQVERTPEAVALVFASVALTYSVLNIRANRLAHHLISLGAGPEVLVGIYMKRSIDLIVAQLAILKTGAAYVPMDPEHPKARLLFTLTDAQAPILLTQQVLLERLPEHQAKVLCIDGDSSLIAANASANPIVRVQADALAYLMYTSGSTGEPKGVAIYQRGVTRLVFAQNYVLLKPTDVVAQVSNPSFDAATFEIWGALLNGAKLTIIHRDDILVPERLVGVLKRERVSCLFLTTALFHRVCELPAKEFSGLRYLLLGGEACDPVKIGKFVASGFDGCLLNVYGPTETTTFATFYPIQAVKASQTRIPIGRPLANTTVYILDEYLQPVPIGVSGILYIGGDGVAHGYWRRPELDLEHFFSDPYSSSNGARMYYTGDTGRWLPDGNIEFLGRVDRQVKLRGFRIELGEIEAAISALAGVKEVVVLSPVDDNGQRSIVAYVVPCESKIDTEFLHTMLAEQLPSYMLPTKFITLKGIPLTTNGKIDTRSLQQYASALRLRQENISAPRDELEIKLCGIWEDTLGGGPVNLDDNFFDLGGHSLMAAELFARQERVLGRSISIAALFQAPTVRELSHLYRSDADPFTLSSLVAINATGSLSPIFAVPGVYGNVLCYRKLSLLLGPNQPFFGLQSVGLDGIQAPLETIQSMASHYIVALKHQQKRGPYHLLGACFGAAVVLEMAHQLNLAGETVLFLGLLDPTSVSAGTELKKTRSMAVFSTRKIALGRFVTNRLGMYFEEIRHLGYADKLRMIARKIIVIGDVLWKRDLLRGDHGEFNQGRVHDANLRALQKYQHQRQDSSNGSLEIFGTPRMFVSGSDKPLIDWADVSGLPTLYFRVPGRDSGDMLSAINAVPLAKLISQRMQNVQNE